MITRLGKHVRKWLHGLALAVRNRAEIAASRLVSVEEKKAREVENKARSGTGKMERIDGPPEHWVRLVKRHAPELLQPAALYVAPHAASQVFDDHAATDAFREAAIQKLKVDNEASENSRGPTDRFFPLKPPRLSEESDALTISGDKRPSGGFSQFSAVSVKTPGYFRYGGERLRSPAKQPGFVKLLQVPALPLETEKNDRMLPLSPDRNDETAHPRTSSAKQQKAETPYAQISFATFSLPDVDHLENTRKSKTHEKKFQPDSGENFSSERRTAGPRVKLHLQRDSSQISSRSDMRMPVFWEFKQQNTYETNPGSDGSSKSPEISPVISAQSLAPQIKIIGNEYRHPEQCPMNDGRHRFHSLEKGKAIKDKRSRPAELRWPGLSDENSSEDLADTDFAAIWPSLPEEQSIGMRSVLQQMETCLSETELRAVERLQRLDEEQKGMPWNVLHF
jgi:hypothetical protein